MRLFLAFATIGLFAALIVLAVVFRSGRAREALGFLRKAAWVYITVIVGLAIWEVYVNGW